MASAQPFQPKPAADHHSVRFDGLHEVF